MIRWKLDRCEPVMEMDSEGEYVEYEDAMQEIEALRQENEGLKQIFEDGVQGTILAETCIAMSEEIEQLRQALLRCSPYTSGDMYGCACDFCGNSIDHEPDCEYIRLTATKQP